MNREGTEKKIGGFNFEMLGYKVSFVCVKCVQVGLVPAHEPRLEIKSLLCTPFCIWLTNGLLANLCYTHDSNVNLHHICSGLHTQLKCFVYSYHSKRQSIYKAARQPKFTTKAIVKVIAS